MEGVRVTGLWKNKAKDGTTFLSGKVNEACSLLIFSNTKKAEGDKGPDFYLYVKANERKAPGVNPAPPEDPF